MNDIRSNEMDATIVLDDQIAVGYVIDSMFEKENELWKELWKDEIRNEDMKIKKYLFDNYRIEYDDTHNAWKRSGGSLIQTKYNYELGKITEIITGVNIIANNTSFVDEKENGIDGNLCVCGCNKCKSLFKLYHKESNNSFLVGSSCIEKAGHTDFTSDMICANKNGRCKNCNIPFRFKGPKKNYKTVYNGLCVDCRIEEVIFLRVNYSEKDFFKINFKTKWNPALKLWYWKGFENELPKQLKDRVLYKESSVIQ